MNYHAYLTFNHVIYIGVHFAKISKNPCCGNFLNLTAQLIEFTLTAFNYFVAVIEPNNFLGNKGHKFPEKKVHSAVFL